MGFLFVMMVDDIDIFAHCSVVLLFWFWIVNLCTVKKNSKHMCIQMVYKVMKHICIY